MSVDGTDCPMQEPTHFNKGRCSHEFHGPRIRCEVAFLCFSECAVVRNGLKHVLEMDEFVVDRRRLR